MNQIGRKDFICTQFIEINFKGLLFRPHVTINANQVHWLSLPGWALYFANTTLSRLLVEAPQVLVVCLLGGSELTWQLKMI